MSTFSFLRILSGVRAHNLIAVSPPLVAFDFIIILILVGYFWKKRKREIKK